MMSYKIRQSSRFRLTALAVAWPLLFAVCFSACGQDDKSESDPDGSESSGTVSSGGGSLPAQQEIKPDLDFDQSLAPIIEDYKSDAAKYGVEIDGELVASLTVVDYVDSTITGADAVCNFRTGIDASGAPVSWSEIHLLKSIFIEDADVVAASNEEQSARNSGYTVEWYYEASNKLTMYHELTHCFLRKGHSVVKGSIMARPWGTEHLHPGQAVIPQTPKEVEESIAQLFSEEYLSALQSINDSTGPL